MFVTHVVRLAEAGGKSFVVVCQLGKHVQRLDVLGIIIEYALSPRDLSDRMQGEAPDLSNAFGNDVGHREKLVAEFIEKQMIIAKVMAAHVPVEILRLQIKRENVRQDRIHRG